MSREQLIGFLIDYMATVPKRLQFSWSDQIKSVSTDEYRKHAMAALVDAAPGERDAADWFAAFGSDLVTEDGVVASTPFDMTVARQNFLADVRSVAISLAGGDAVAAFDEALFGPWQYNDDQHSLGWDPSTMRLGAFTPEAPTNMKTKRSVRAAVWLAFESLPLFPCFAQAGALRTRGVRRERRRDVMVWPVWSHPLSIDAVRTLIGLDELWERPDLAFERGVEAVYESLQFKPNKYMVSFQPAVLVAGAG